MLIVNIKIQLIVVGTDDLFNFSSSLSISARNLYCFRQKSNQKNFRSAKVRLASFKPERFFIGWGADRGLKVFIINIKIQLIFVGGDGLFTVF